MKKIQKAASLTADVVCFDLEDGVCASEKMNARNTVVEGLRTLNFGKTEKLIRINRAGSGLEIEDLKTILSKVRPDGIVIPKAEDPSALSKVMKLLGDFENRYHVHSIIMRETPAKRVQGQEESRQVQHTKSLQKFSVFLGIETAKGVCCVRDLASSAPEIMDDRLEGFLFGAEDYAADVGAKRSKGNQEVAYARAAILNVAAAYGLQAIDMVHLNIKDLDSLQHEAMEAADMGFAGKQVIHPAQVEVVHTAFSPSVEDILASFTILKTFLTRQQFGEGVFQLDGRMIDLPLAIGAAKILQKTKMIEDKEEN